MGRTAFGSSTSLAGAYGMAVTGTMSITSVLFFMAMRQRWRRLRTAALTAAFLMVDLSFLVPNLAKARHGGWFPLALALGFLETAAWRKP